MKYTQKPRQREVSRFNRYYMEKIRIQIQAVDSKVLYRIFNTATI